MRVHTTQFAIREVGLYDEVLGLAIDTANQWSDQPMVMIGGLAGPTEQAVNETRTASRLQHASQKWAPVLGIKTRENK